MSKQLGYKYRGIPSATGVAAFFSIVPANEVGLGVNTHYLPVLKRGTRISSKGGNKYMLEEDIRFDDPNNEVVVARVDDSTGYPTSYAVKAYGKITSGELKRERIPVGNFSKFKKVPLTSRNIAEIISVIDEEGHEYFEVDYLSQDVVYRAVTNMGDNKDTVPYIMKPMTVPRRFVLDREDGRYYLQFGYGSDSELNSSSVAEPSSVTLKMHARDFISDTAFDPAKLLQTDKFGVGPAKTTLTVNYRINSTGNTNARIGGVNKVNSVIMDFARPELVSPNVRDSILKSFEVYNEEKIVGGVSIPSTKELKIRAFDYFATQNRAVTLQDFESIAYAMHPKFGSLKRIKVVQDPDSFKRNLNMYVLAESRNGYLTEANSTLKENLKLWLNNDKMIHDTVDILDGKIVNFGIEFSAIADPQFNKFEVLSRAQAMLASKFTQPLYMGESIYITDIISALNKDVEGLIDVKKVKIVSRSSAAYSRATFDFDSQTSADGRVLMVPDNVCMELKYPDADIKGTLE